jgi:hypothetical protein
MKGAFHHRQSTARSGLAQIEIVMITGATLPLAVAMFFMTIEAFQYLYSLVSTLLSWTCL